MRPAVELSYLQEEEMRDLVDYIDTEGTFSSHAQTIRMRALSKEGKLDTDAINTIMNEEKPNQKARIKIPMKCGVYVLLDVVYKASEGAN